MITDNGKQFTNKSLKSFLENLGVNHQITVPYTPQENQTERAYHTVTTIIAQYAGDNQRNWDEGLPDLMLAVNSSVSAGYRIFHLETVGT